MWTIIADYFFDNVTGILIAENLYIHRYDFKPLKPISYSTKDLYINRTLAMVNSMIIMDSYEKIGENTDPRVEDLYIWIVSVAVIIPCAVITIILLRKQIFKHK